jgi:hypothetical protein
MLPTPAKIAPARHSATKAQSRFFIPPNQGLICTPSDAPSQGPDLLHDSQKDRGGFASAALAG